MLDKQSHNSRVLVVGDVSDSNVWGNTAFNERKTAEKSQQFILNSKLPISSQRDTVSEVNGATVSQQGAEYRLRSTTASSSAASLETQQRGVYIAGNENESGLGVRIPVSPTGDAYVRWGYYKNDSGVLTGLFYELTSDGLFVNIYDEGVEKHREEQDAWNANKLPDFDVNDGHVYQINYVYYGYGSITFEIGDSYDTNRYSMIPVHVAKVKNSVSLSEPNLPITIEVNSGTSGQQLDAYVGGRQYATFGKIAPLKRDVGAYRLSQTGIDTNFVPVISLRYKAGRESIQSELKALTFIADADLVFEFRWNATLTGASFAKPNNYTANECATEWDISATVITGGETRKSGLVEGGRQSAFFKDQLPEKKISEGDTVTLCVRTVTGANVTSTSHLEIQELW